MAVRKCAVIGSVAIYPSRECMSLLVHVCSVRGCAKCVCSVCGWVGVQCAVCVGVQSVCAVCVGVQSVCVCT